MALKVWNFIKRYPIPFFALLGLFLGAIFKIFFNDSSFSDWTWYATLIFGGLPIVYKTFRGMLTGYFASDVVAMLAIVIAVVMDQAFAGAVVVLMQSGGEAIEDFGMKRAASSLESLISRAPRAAYRKTDGRIEKIDAKDIRIGDILIVRAGDLIPADGTILKGSCEIDESAVTGEPLGKAKGPQDRVYSGSIDVNGSFEMRADKTSKDSQYEKIIRLVQEARQEKAPIQRLADRYAVIFTPLALLIALAGYFITNNPITPLSVLVVATPCPLILATPLAVLCGINKAAESGIIVKGGTPLEQIGRAQIVVFDKTGTITYGTPILEEIVPFYDLKEEELIFKAAVVEQLSSHSLAKTFVDKAYEHTNRLPMPSNPKEDPGRGVSGTIEGEEISIGSFVFVEEKIGLQGFDPHRGLIERYMNAGKQLVYLSDTKKCLGFFVVNDQLRPSVPRMVSGLYDLGVKDVVMLTGDVDRNAREIARQAGIKTVASQLLPEQKVEMIKKLTGRFDPIIMVGDGINDAPALASATVGIAMGAHGSAISAEAADIVLLEDEPSKVIDAILISRRMLYIAKQSIFWGMGLSLGLMLIAAAGKIIPAVGALLQEIIDVVVILNALRAKK